MVNRGLRIASLRELRKHPAQVLLSLLGIALGVAVMVAVDLANNSARQAFRLSMETLSGRANYRMTGAHQPLEDDLYRRLRVELAVRPSTPIVEGYVSLAGETFRLLGVDPFSDGEFRGMTGTLADGEVSTLLREPNSVLVAANDAERLQLATGSSLQVKIAGRSHRLEIAGRFTSDPPAATEGTLIADIATAQELLDRLGQLDRIELILDAASATALQQQLPESVQLEKVDANHGHQAKMSAAFHTNLAAMSLLALLVGALLVYNTITFALLRRRRLLGLLRVIGATRSDLFRLILTEALILGAVGSLLGLLLGTAIGHGLVSLVTRTINDLYFVLTVNSLLVSPWVLVKGLVVGVAVTLGAGLAPALDATRVSPHEATGRSSLERQAQRLAPPLALVGIGLGAIAFALLQLPSKSLTLAFGAVFAFILGFAFVVPWLLQQFSRRLTPLLARLFGNVGRLAGRSVNAGLSRTGVAVAALSVAVAATVGVGIMVGSFRTTVALWLEQSLTSDVYVTLPGSDEDQRRNSLPPRLLGQLEAIRGVTSLTQGRPDELRSPYGPLPALALHDTAALSKSFRFKHALDDVWRMFRAGQAVLVSEALAYHHDLEIGDALPLVTAAGERPFIVGGVFIDYSTDRGRLVIDRATHADLWRDEGTTTAGVRIAPNADYDQVLLAIRKIVAGYDTPYRVVANAEIRAQSMAVFDRTFTITGVLRMLAIGVALIGVLTALLALQLEKAREHATLRAIGVTPVQLGVLVSLECGLMGLAAGLLALPLGWTMAQLLIEVINQRAFGWSMPSLLPQGVLAEALMLAIGAALLAGLYPAWRLATAPPITALREE